MSSSWSEFSTISSTWKTFGKYLSPLELSSASPRLVHERGFTAGPSPAIQKRVPTTENPCNQAGQRPNVAWSCWNHSLVADRREFRSLALIYHFNGEHNQKPLDLRWFEGILRYLQLLNIPTLMAVNFNRLFMELHLGNLLWRVSCWRFWNLPQRSHEYGTNIANPVGSSTI